MKAKKKSAKRAGKRGVKDLPASAKAGSVKGGWAITSAAGPLAGHHGMHGRHGRHRPRG